MTTLNPSAMIETFLTEKFVGKRISIPSDDIVNSNGNFEGMIVKWCTVYASEDSESGVTLIASFNGESEYDWVDCYAFTDINVSE
jgi:hypothetical protein